MERKSRTQDPGYQRAHTTRSSEEPALNQPPLPGAIVDPYQSNYYNENTQVIYPPHPTYYPPRPFIRKNGRKFIYLTAAALVIALVIVAIGVLAFLPRLRTIYTHINNAQRPAILSVPGTSSNNNNQKNQDTPNIFSRGNNIASTLRNHTADIQTRLAQELKLSNTQLAQELQNGQTVTQIASAQGLNSAQQQQLISDALHSALQTEVENGNLTQQQLDTFIERVQDNPIILNHLLQ